MLLDWSMNHTITHAFAASLLIAPLACEHGGETTAATPETTEAQIQEAHLQQSKEKIEATQELNKATTVLREMTQGTDIAKEQRDSAHCVIVVPNMGSGAFIVGGQSGSGVVACRTQTDWTAPAFVKMGGVTVGLQAGGQSADLVILATTTDAPGKIFSKNFEFGAGASVAAGPVGAGTRAGTSKTADFLTYARSRGLFAGVDLSGVSVKPNEKPMKAMYGADADPIMVLSGRVPVPPEASAFVGQLRSSFPRPPTAVSAR